MFLQPVTGRLAEGEVQSFLVPQLQLSSNHCVCLAAANYRQIGKGAGAVVLGASATVAATKGKERRGQAASIALYNDLMQRSDPGSITLPEVQQIGQK